MPTATHSIDLPLSQDDAFALLTDSARYEEWLTLHSGWPSGAPAELTADAEFVQKLKIMGMPADVTWKVTELSAPERVVLQGDGPMGAVLATTMSTAANGATTTVTYAAEFSGGGIQGPMGSMVTKTAGKELVTSLDNLKSLAG